jgi:spore germination cell wall hydrolase CwlJ-like protein
MLQLSSNDRRSQGMLYPQARRGRRIGWMIGALVVLLAIAGGIFAAYQLGGERKSVRLDISKPPPPLPALKQGFMPIDPAKAELVNAGIAISTSPIERSRPFVLPPVTMANLAAHQSAVDCLTAAIYYEAASESDAGQRAVAQVVLNRVRHPAFPKTVCGVVYQGAERRTGCQFSFTCDGSLARIPSRAGWDRARGIAAAALAGYVEPAVGTATHYHTQWVVPYWAWSLDKITVLGAHIFYRWKGYWGRRSAFNGIYAGETISEEQSPLLLPEFPEEGALMSEESSRPLGPRPLADELGGIASGPSPAQPATVPLRADQENGTLATDEKVGTLVQAAPKKD